MAAPVLALIGLGAGILYLVNRGGSGGGGSSHAAASLDPAVVARMNEAITSKDGEKLVSSLTELVQLKSDNPQVGQAISMIVNMLNQQQPVKEVIAGQSGRKWKLQVAAVMPTGEVYRDVFTPSGSKVLRFKRDIKDPASVNRLLEKSASADAAIVSQATQDFNIK